MGFARRLLSRVGIGAATVDTRLEKAEFTPGEEVRGVVEIKGGGTDQEIEGIYLAVQTYYKREVGDDTTTVTESGALMVVLRKDGDAWVIVAEHYSHKKGGG